MLQFHSIFVASILLVTALQTDASMEEIFQSIAKAEQECAETIGVPWSDIEKLGAGDTSVLNYDIKCTMKCTLQTIGVMDSLGNLLMDNAEKLMAHDPDNAPKYQECAAIEDPDACEKGFSIVMCIAKVAGKA